MAEIKPALTAEEWAEMAAPPIIPGQYTNRGENLLAWAEDDTHLNRHQLAAIALHGQPFGFAWDDVDRLRATNDSALGSLADRIAALLPPRT